LQLALPPMASLPAAAAVTAVYAVTAGHLAGAWILAVQALVTAGLMTLVRRAGQNAEEAIAAGLLAEQELRAQAARRADDREAHRQLHDTVLSTLTMVALGAFARPSRVLAAQAAGDLQVLAPADDVGSAGEGEMEQLGVRLQQVADEAAPLRVRLDIEAVSVPSGVAEATVRCVAEALRNVIRHAGIAEAAVSVRCAGGGMVVEIIDQGGGFDPAQVPAGRRGLRESMVGRMAAAGGAAEVASRPGRGTTVVLRWPG
jgi:signal transduction histidine kinase